MSRQVGASKVMWRVVVGAAALVVLSFCFWVGEAQTSRALSPNNKLDAGPGMRTPRRAGLSVPRAGRVIEVRVRGRDDRPVVGLRVQLESDGTNASGTTDDSGRVSIAVAASSQIAVRIRGSIVGWLPPDMDVFDHTVRESNRVRFKFRTGTNQPPLADIVLEGIKEIERIPAPDGFVVCYSGLGFGPVTVRAPGYAPTLVRVTPDTRNVVVSLFRSALLHAVLRGTNRQVPIAIEFRRDHPRAGWVRLEPSVQERVLRAPTSMPLGHYRVVASVSSTSLGEIRLAGDATLAFHMNDLRRVQVRILAPAHHPTRPRVTATKPSSPTATEVKNWSSARGSLAFFATRHRFSFTLDHPAFAYTGMNLEPGDEDVVVEATMTWRPHIRFRIHPEPELHPRVLATDDESGAVNETRHSFFLGNVYLAFVATEGLYRTRIVIDDDVVVERSIRFTAAGNDIGTLALR